MSTRKISYIEADEDYLEIEVEKAIDSSIEQNMKNYYLHIKANYAMAGIDVTNYPVERIIYYIEDGEKQP